MARESPRRENRYALEVLCLCVSSDRRYKLKTTVDSKSVDYSVPVHQDGYSRLTIAAPVRQTGSILELETVRKRVEIMIKR